MACVVSGCKSGRATTEHRTISFHRFPADEELKSTWIKNIKNGDDWIPPPNSRICSLHFEKSCYRKGYNRSILHTQAVPTIFSFNSKSTRPVIPRTSKFEIIHRQRQRERARKIKLARAELHKLARIESQKLANNESQQSVGNESQKPARKEFHNLASNKPLKPRVSTERVRRFRERRKLAAFYDVDSLIVEEPIVKDGVRLNVERLNNKPLHNNLPLSQNNLKYTIEVNSHQETTIQGEAQSIISLLLENKFHLFGRSVALQLQSLSEIKAQKLMESIQSLIDETFQQPEEPISTSIEVEIKQEPIEEEAATSPRVEESSLGNAVVKIEEEPQKIIFKTELV